MMKVMKMIIKNLIVMIVTVHLMMVHPKIETSYSCFTQIVLYFLNIILKRVVILLQMRIMMYIYIWRLYYISSKNSNIFDNLKLKRQCENYKKYFQLSRVVTKEQTNPRNIFVRIVLIIGMTRLFQKNISNQLRKELVIEWKVKRQIVVWIK